jgi:stage III sporulation protein SpoIIIAA
MLVLHKAIGRARRMVVASSQHQGAIILEALIEYNSCCIIIDKLSHTGDVQAASSICQCGIALVATAHTRNSERAS